MKIFPNGTLYIIKDCPCDPDYEHTLYFESKEAQHAYFLALHKYIDHAVSYQRTKSGKIRIQHCADDLYDCNYIAFRNNMPTGIDNPNKTFSSKWFYAFLDDVEYVSPTVCDISYTIDVLQTWLFDFTLQECFVEREHSATDEVGDNLIPENLDVGEMLMYEGMRSMLDLTEVKPMIIVAKGTTSAGGSFDPGFYGSTFSTCSYEAFPATQEGCQQIVDWLSQVGLWNNPQAVINIFMSLDNLAIVKTDSPSFAHGIAELPNANPLRRLDNEKVKNNKLMTYPYTFLRVSNLSGQVHDYKYELFPNRSNGIKFDTYYSYSDKLSITFVPRAYKTYLEYDVVNMPDESITYSAFPSCSYAVTDFVRRIALGGISAVLAALSAGGSAGAVVGSALASGTGAFLTGSPSIVNLNDYGAEPPQDQRAGKRLDRSKELPVYLPKKQAGVFASMAGSIRPFTVNVAPNAGNDLFNGGLWGARWAQMVPTREFITKIDDYFSRFGYKTNAIKIPNIAVRKIWTYTQTVGCKINGSIPCQDEKLICSIFDKGVTFWRDASNVGNFSGDNSPLITEG